MIVKQFIKFLLESVDNDEFQEIRQGQISFKNRIKQADGSILTGINIRPNLLKKYYEHGEE